MRMERCVENPMSHLTVLTKIAESSLFIFLDLFLKIKLNNYDIKVLGCITTQNLIGFRVFKVGLFKFVVAC